MLHMFRHYDAGIPQAPRIKHKELVGHVLAEEAKSRTTTETETKSLGMTAAAATPFFLTASPVLLKLLERGKMCQPPKSQLSVDTSTQIISFLDTGSLVRLSAVCASWFSLAASTDIARIEKHWRLLHMDLIGECSAARPCGFVPSCGKMIGE